MLGKKILGTLWLGVRATVIHPAQLALHGEPGAGRFRENYLTEGLIPTTEADRELLREASRCVHCGLCDAALEGEARPGEGEGEGRGARPSLVPLVFARGTTELPLAKGALRELRDSPGLLAAAERLCPERVPLVRLAAWLSLRLSRVEDALRVGSP